MCDRNIGSPHVGHGRLPTGGLKYAIAALCVPLTYRREHNWSLGHRRLMPSAVGDVRQCLLIENLSLERCRKRKALHVR